MTAELSAYSKHLTILLDYGAFTQDVAHFITDSWPTNVPAALSSLYSSWTASDEQVPDFYTAAVSFFESITKVNEALSMGLIGTSQLSFIASYSYDAPLPSSDYFTPTALREAAVTPTPGVVIGEVGLLGVTCVLTNASQVPTGSLTTYGSPLFPTSVPADLTSFPGLAPVFTSEQTRTGGIPTALPGLGRGPPQDGLDVNAGQLLQPVTPISTGFFPGFDSFTTGQVQTAGGEGDVSAVPGIGGPLTSTGITIIQGPSNFPIIQPGTVIGSGQVQTQGSGVFLLETGAGFTIFDAPELTAPITLFDRGSTTRNLATRTVTVTVAASPSVTTLATSSSGGGSFKTVSSATLTTTTIQGTAISSAAAAPGQGRGSGLGQGLGLGMGHVTGLERLAAVVVGWMGLRGFLRMD